MPSTVLRCATGACVEVDIADGVVAVTSTVAPGRVEYTRTEWDTFLAQVKAGGWDHTRSPGDAA